MLKRFLLLGLTLVCGAAAATTAGAVASERPLSIYFIDVEGGAATLIVTPARESILIDTGWPGLENRDPLRIQRAVRDAGLERIDHLVTTHWHVDHYGGIEGLAKLLPVRKYWDRGIPEALREDTRNFPTLIAAYQRASAGRRQTLTAGESIPLKPVSAKIELEVVAASGKVMPEAGGEPQPGCDEHPARPVDRSDNAQSIAIRLRLGEFDFLNCGDLTWNVEHQLVCPRNRIGKVDLYQVTHHGMDTSNNPLLVRAIEPVCAVMANGPRKGGAPAVMELLKSLPSLKAWYQLHRNVAIPEDAQAPRMRIANWDDTACGDYLRVDVTPDGRSYRVYTQAGRPIGEFQTR